MQPGLPSRTALGAARHRAAHQVLEQGRIFADPLALRILGPDAGAAIRQDDAEPARRALRLFVAIRSRFTDDAFAAAVARGVRQLVVLGAGLDTMACRTADREGVRAYEVDHPATQAWKRARLAAAGIAVPASLTFVPVDFERTTLAEALPGAGFEPSRPAFFSWLGVVPYLTETAVFSTLAFIAALPGGAEIVFDYGNPVASGTGESRLAAAHRKLAARVAAAGEAFQSSFETEALHLRLRASGFREVEDLGPSAIRERYFPDRPGPADDRGGHIIRAAT
jgi:methyltransferase (TIGR00027 family)